MCIWYPALAFLWKFFFLKGERERERKKSHCQSRIQQTEQSQHSCLEKNVGLKAWSCLTCIISPSTHPSITVLSVWGCAAYDLPRLKKKKVLKLRGGETRKTLSGSNRFKIRCNQWCLDSFRIDFLVSDFFYFFLNLRRVSVSWRKMTDERRAQWFH